MPTAKGKGFGPTLTEMSERWNHRSIAGVAKKGQDLGDFSGAPEPDETRKRSDFSSKLTDGSENRVEVFQNV